MEEQEMELRRHIDDWLAAWKSNPNRKPALIKGIRQSGKTHAIRKFASDKTRYEVVVYLNFWDNPGLCDAFDDKLDIDSIITELSVKLPLPRLVPGKTVFIFDEVQDCPRALLSLKTNQQERRFDFIASGSYLGIRGYVVGDDTPKPVGSTDSFDMRTMGWVMCRFPCSQPLWKRRCPSRMRCTHPSNASSGNIFASGASRRRSRISS